MSAELAQVILQPELSPGVEAPGTTPTPTGAPPGCDPGSMNIGFLVAMVAIFYFLLIRPQQKRQREMDEMLKALRKGDIVRTNGGIRGEITALSERDVTLLVAERTRINVLRTHIAGVEPKEDEKK